MGATEFFTVGVGETPRKAFNSAVEEARWEYGHGGYTGTIAEKHDFNVLTVPEGREAVEYAEELVGKDDSRVADKWGPAGCIKLEEKRYLFFGVASE